MTIKELREKYSLSQTALAKSIGVSGSTISAIESGRMKASAKIADAVKTVYGEVVETGGEKAAEVVLQMEEKAEKKVVNYAETAMKKLMDQLSGFVVQSPLGGEITPEMIYKKVGDVDRVYIRVDQNKAYWVKGEETGSVDLW